MFKCVWWGLSSCSPSSQQSQCAGRILVIGRVVLWDLLSVTSRVVDLWYFPIFVCHSVWGVMPNVRCLYFIGLKCSSGILPQCLCNVAVILLLNRAYLTYSLLNLCALITCPWHLSFLFFFLVGTEDTEDSSETFSLQKLCRIINPVYAARFLFFKMENTRNTNLTVCAGL